MKAAVLYGNEDLRYDDYPTPEVTPGTVKGESPGYRNLHSMLSGASPWSPFLSRCAGPRVFRRCSRGGGRRNQA